MKRDELKRKHELDNNLTNVEVCLSDMILTNYSLILDPKFLIKDPASCVRQNRSNEELNNEILKKDKESEKLEKRINSQAKEMFNLIEEKYCILEKKKSELSNDKEAIEKLITRLDVKRKQAIFTAWKKINIDIGIIFNMFSSGNSAKLSEPKGSTFTNGLEVNVCFGGIWKKSLNELSGGQRSLLAISFILALLRFKPAPVYILDEIDAALDLGHTQNLGHIIKTKFSQSQFIIVSLKEGMFNNATVLFNVKFIDGQSSIKRLTPV